MFKKIPLIFIIILTLVSFQKPKALKKISDENFRYEFYITDKAVDPNPKKTYYWFKGGAVHQAQGGIAGNLLDDEFSKFYHSNQLAEKGIFKKGLKVGLWISWHPNGVIMSTQHWNKGLKTGYYYRYNENGNLVEKGKYRNDKKAGRWINLETNDTTKYRKGTELAKKKKLSKEEKEVLKETQKREKEALKETQKKEKAEKKKKKEKHKKDKNNKAQKKISQQPTPKKDNFFRRTFDKLNFKKKNGQST